MRTNIVLDDRLVEEAMHLSGIRTKREVVDAALHAFVMFQRQRSVLALEGAVSWEGDLNILRTVRFIAQKGGEYDAGSGDTSVWIDFLRGRATPQVTRLKELLARPGPIW